MSSQSPVGWKEVLVVFEDVELVAGHDELEADGTVEETD